MNTQTAFRASILHFTDMPKSRSDTTSYQYWKDGLLVVADGKVVAVGDTAEIKKTLPENTQIIDYSGYLIMPGFIDTHIHYPQTEIIASYGEQLLEWLNNYVFPTERKFADKDYAKEVANFFLIELLRNGTTTALVLPSVHSVSVDALFESARRLQMCMISGKILMDRNAPEYLRDTPELAYTESTKLIKKWHKKSRFYYAITPRFAITSTEAQLEVTKTLLKENPDVYLHTHLAENIKEVEFVRELFPQYKDYTDVYDHYNLLGKRSIFAHGVHISDREFQRLIETESVVPWCPTSNFFLGSGLFDVNKAVKLNLRIGLATDVGGGSTFSMLRVLNEAYKVAALQGVALSPLKSFYYLTLGNAKALSLENQIGNFAQGKFADFLVIDLKSTPLLAFKAEHTKSLEDALFDLSILASDRAIKATYVCGELLHRREFDTTSFVHSN
ncbi:MAG: guanine deaminase [Gammaproteobacteria bacterium]|nr:guanine deaminase [Gammaproteobacteria bacterium]